MATSNKVNELIINDVENQEVYEYMKNNGLINENELYLVGGANEAILYTPQTLTELKKAQARENIGAINESEVNELITNAITGAMEASY